MIYPREVGPKCEAIQHYGAKIPEQVAGQHLWIVVAMYQVKRPKAGMQVIMDMENLLTIEGIGCYWCEEKWTPDLEKQKCRGHG